MAGLESNHSDREGPSGWWMTSNSTAVEHLDQVTYGILVVFIALIGCISNGLATYFLATDAQFRHSTGIICINIGFANFAYSAIYLLYVGPMMLLNLGLQTGEPMPSFSLVVWFLFFAAQYFSFCLSANRACAVLFPLAYYQHATVRTTMYICVFVWVISTWHLIFFLLKICPGIWFNAVQSYLLDSSSISSTKPCVDFLRVNIEMYLLIGLSAFSLCSDVACAFRVMLSPTIRAKMKASDLQFLYQSLFSSIFLCIECFLAGYVVANFVISLTVYFILTTLNRVLGRATSGLLVLSFHRKLRARILRTFLSACVTMEREVTLVHPQRLISQGEPQSNKSTDTNGSRREVRTSPI
ncbi:unnamed protein product, partial [Mesorhabditis spiculigera]